MATKGSVAVIGTGVIGLATAENLARSGVPVTVIDNGKIGDKAATIAAAGVIAPDYDKRDLVHSKPYAELYRGGQRLYSELPEDVKKRVEYSQSRIIEVASSMETLLTYRQNYKDAGFQCELLTPSELASLEPALSRGFPGALYLKEISGHVNPGALLTYLAEDCTRLGVDIRENIDILKISRVNGGFRLQSDNDIISAEYVVNAAGTWASSVCGLLDERLKAIDIRPVMGYTMTFAQPGIKLNVDILNELGATVQLQSGAIRVGGGSIMNPPSTWKTELNQQLIDRLVSEARQAVPALESVKIEQVQPGLRPATSDLYPVIGRIAPDSNFLIGGAHFRCGITLGLQTGKDLADMIRDGTDGYDDFSPRRFLK